MTEITKEQFAKDNNLDIDEVYTTKELQKEFTVESFMAPVVIVVRKSDGERGSLEFTHMPRFYFNFR